MNTTDSEQMLAVKKFNVLKIRFKNYF